MKYHPSDPYVREIAYDHIIKPIAKLLKKIPIKWELRDNFCNVIDQYQPNGVTLIGNTIIVDNDFNMPDSIPETIEQIKKI